MNYSHKHKHSFIDSLIENYKEKYVRNDENMIINFLIKIKGKLYKQKY